MREGPKLLKCIVSETYIVKTYTKIYSNLNLPPYQSKIYHHKV